MEKGRCIIVDIDGTLADCRHRLHHVLPGGKRDWQAFFEAMGDDLPIGPVVDLVMAAFLEYKIVLSSGRPADHRRETIHWLNLYGIGFDDLYMRPAGDTRPDHVVKREMLDKIREDGYEPFIVIDDRPSVVNMWREAGLICLQTAPGEQEIPKTAVLTLMVGPSGAGKTTWLNSELWPLFTKYETHPEELGISANHVVSSDQVRADLLGDFRDQSQNQRVFEVVHNVAKSRLRAGLPTVIDATHLRRKDRMTSVQLVPSTVPVRYVVIDRPLEEKIASGGWRAEIYCGTKDIPLVEKHHQAMQSQLKEILRGDGLPNVTVHDLRQLRTEEKSKCS
jgi:predicted kinase